MRAWYQSSPKRYYKGFSLRNGISKTNVHCTEINEKGLRVLQEIQCLSEEDRGSSRIIRGRENAMRWVTDEFCRFRAKTRESNNRCPSVGLST